MDVSRKERAYDWSLEKCVGHPRLIQSGAPRNRQTDALSPCLATANHVFNLGKHTHMTNMVTLTCRQKNRKRHLSDFYQATLSTSVGAGRIF